METAVVVTGLSAIAPNGGDLDTYWDATLRGISGVSRISGFDVSAYPVQLAGQVRDLDVEAHISSRLIPQTDRVTRFALIAADRALADARVDLSQVPEYASGVITSNAVGGVEFSHAEIEKLWAIGPKEMSVYQSFAWFYAANTGQISIKHGVRGPSSVLVSEQAGGLDAIGYARRQIRKGTELVIAGGMESALDPWGLACQIASRRLSRELRPDYAYRPFHPDASGYVPGEGGALLVLEEEGAAVRRGATIYGEIAGYAATFDPPPGSARPHGLQRAAELALADARIEARDVDVVFADSAALPQLDRIEAEALVRLFGPFGVPVTATKTMTGRLCAGGASLDVATALLCLRDGVIPPTVNVNVVSEDCQIDLVRDNPRSAAARTALVLARGYGGFNAAVVLRGSPAPDC